MKTKGFIFLVLAAFCILPAYAGKIKGNGKVVTKEIAVGAFDAVQLKASIEFNSGLRDWIKGNDKVFPALHYRQQGSRIVKVKTDENLFSHLTVEVRDRCLTIRTKEHEHLVPTYLQIEAGSDELNKIKITGSLDFVLESRLSDGDLEINVSGSGDITMSKPVRKRHIKLSISGSGDVSMRDVECVSFIAKTTGSGDVSLRGAAREGEYKITGSGDISAYGFRVDDLYCSVSGSGDIEAYAVKTLKARASGSGDISYRGPARVDKSSTGSGDIEKD